MDCLSDTKWLLYAGSTVIAVSVWYALQYMIRASHKADIRNKVVLITGASSGLGEACAHAFYHAGAKVILCARRRHELARVKEDLMRLNKCQEPHEPMIIEMDLTEFDRMPLRVEEALNIHGQIDILINNGGISYRGEVEMTGVDVDIKVMNVNYLGQVALTKAVLPFMIGKNSGHIVAISSVQGRLAIPFRSSYAASKHALQAFFDSLRAEVACHDVQVSVISPGYVKTNLSVNAVTGDGSSYGVTDSTTAAGMSPEYVAKRVLEAVVYRDKEVVLTSLIHRLVILLRTMCPRLFFWLMASRANKQRKNFRNEQQR